jgi:S1-C subfamily serine protease
MLYSNGVPICSAQIVHSEKGRGDIGVETVVLTANHCISSPSSDLSFAVAKVTDDNKMLSVTLYGADLVKQHPKHEIAVLKLRDTETVFPAVDVATAEEAKEALAKGTRILAVGYPGTSNLPMNDLIITDGLYVGLTDSMVKSVEVLMYRTTISIWYGNSGGGLYALIGDDWKFVGVTSQLDPERPWNTSLFAPVDDKSEVLRGAWNPDLSDPAYREK